jgi:hypothetical protein
MVQRLLTQGLLTQGEEAWTFFGGRDVVLRPLRFVNFFFKVLRVRMDGSFVSNGVSFLALCALLVS